MSVKALDSGKPASRKNTIRPTNDYAAKPSVHQLFSTSNRKLDSDNPFFHTRLDTDSSAFWLSLRPDCPPKFTLELVQAFRAFQTSFSNYYQNRAETHENPKCPEYLVFNSEIADTFNLGGDLPYFYVLIKNGDRQRLTEYASTCVELIYQNSTAMGLPMTSIALVKGSAMGGGMEAALAANVLVAERQVTMGLPEVLFNMFPGMGAYQFLSRRLPPVAAEKFILSGRTYTAEELYEMGIVDVLADEGKGEQAVNEYISRRKRTGHASRALRRAVGVADPVSRESLMSVVDIWVEAAMTLSERDLGHMHYLIRAQQKRGF